MCACNSKYRFSVDPSLASLLLTLKVDATSKAFIIVCLSHASGHVKLIVELGIVDGELVGRDPNNGTCSTRTRLVPSRFPVTGSSSALLDPLTIFVM